MKSLKNRFTLIFITIVTTFLFGLIGLSQAIFPNGFLPSFQLSKEYEVTQPLKFQSSNQIEQAFIADQLKTNTAKRSIELSEVLGGGPAKDGIPALTEPQYLTVTEANRFYNDESEGVLVDINGDARWFSFDVLYWHEIINDTLGGTPIAVTFCPLCGSAITYDRRLKDETTLEFGVSGKLWQSNLMMYDQLTESLWSQIEGEAKIGDLTGQTLELINSSVVPWGEVKNTPQLKVLSRETGYVREYGKNPYGTYENSAELIFPVNTQDQSLPPKTIMIAGEYKNTPFAIERLPLLNRSQLSLTVAGEALNISVQDSLVTVRNANQEIIPTFNTMWFSWANHWRTDDAVVWFETDSAQTKTPETGSKTINLYEYFSYGCSYCDQIHDTLDTVLKQFSAVNLELKHFIVYEQFMPIHEAQVCAAEQNQGYAFHDAYFRNYYPKNDALTAFQVAEDLTLDLTEFSNCKASERPQAVINSDMQEGVALGVRGTPTLLIEGPQTSLRAFTSRTQTAMIEELNAVK